MEISYCPFCRKDNFESAGQIRTLVTYYCHNCKKYFITEEVKPNNSLQKGESNDSL
jgi:transposase-like protein